MTLTPSGIESLATALSRWEIAEYIFAGLVTVACFGEFVGEFTNWFTDGVEEAKDSIRKISTLALVAALSLELVCLVKTNDLSGRLIGSLGEKAEKAATDAALASGRVLALDKELDKLVERMDKASALLGELELELLSQSPRWRLLEAGKDNFIETLKPFAGQRFIIVECGGSPSPEPYKLEEDLENFLRAAGWERVPLYASWESCGNGTGNGATSEGGNLIAFNANATPKMQDAAKALHDALNKLSIFTTSFKAPPTPSPSLQQLLGDDAPFVRASKDSTALFVLVGLNPMASPAGAKKAAQKPTTQHK
jgi:hypothetical protein